MFGKAESPYGNYALRAFVLHTVSGVKPQQRPQLVCDADTTTLERVAGYMAERDGARVTARSVARELGGVLHYGRETLPARPIQGGWEAQRLSFVLALDHVSPIGLNTTYTIAGYTDRMPIRREDKVDWADVTFYVNSFIHEHRSVTRTVEGEVRHVKLSEAQHLLYDADFSNVKDEREIRVRPTDIASGFTTLNLADMDLVDTRTMLTSMAQVSNRRHVLPSRFLADLMRAYFTASAQESYPGSMSSNEESIISMARSILDPGSLSMNPIFRTFSHTQGRPFDGRFTMADLQQILPAVIDKAVVAFEDYSGPEEDSPVSEAPNQALVYLGQTVPALFHSMGFSTAQFQVDMPYHDDTEPFRFTFVDTRGFAGNMDTMVRLRHVEGIMSREILPELSRMGCEGGSLFFNVNTFGNSSIQYNLFFGSTYQGKRHFATYADALTSPLVMEGRPTSLRLVTHLYTVLNAALEGTENRSEEVDSFTI